MRTNIEDYNITRSLAGELNLFINATSTTADPDISVIDTEYSYSERFVIHNTIVDNYFDNIRVDDEILISTITSTPTPTETTTTTDTTTTTNGGATSLIDTTLLIIVVGIAGVVIVALVVYMRRR
ncbi:MAG: hypothetical protein RTV31_06675 [Candidatus Thorarchaeota archaeon]